jgi:hypothetical protein
LKDWLANKQNKIQRFFSPGEALPLRLLFVLTPLAVEISAPAKKLIINDFEAE